MLPFTSVCVTVVLLHDIVLKVTFEESKVTLNLSPSTLHYFIFVRVAGHWPALGLCQTLTLDTLASPTLQEHMTSSTEKQGVDFVFIPSRSDYKKKVHW